MAFCTNCGAKLEDGVKFCTGCGTALPASKAAEVAPSAVAEDVPAGINEEAAESTEASAVAEEVAEVACEEPVCDTAAQEEPVCDTAAEEEPCEDIRAALDEGEKHPVRVFCKHCGFNIPEGDKFCPQCGTRVGETGAQPVPPVQPVQPVQPQVVYVVQEEKKQHPRKGRAVCSLVFGILSFIFCIPFGLPFSIVGLATGNSALKAGKIGSAKAGKVLSIIALILSIIIVVLSVLCAIGALIGGGAAVFAALKLVDSVVPDSFIEAVLSGDAISNLVEGALSGKGIVSALTGSVTVGTLETVLGEDFDIGDLENMLGGEVDLGPVKEALGEDFDIGDLSDMLGEDFGLDDVPELLETEEGKELMTEIFGEDFTEGDLKSLIEDIITGGIGGALSGSTSSGIISSSPSFVIGGGSSAGDVQAGENLVIVSTELLFEGLDGEQILISSQGELMGIDGAGEDMAFFKVSYYRDGDKIIISTNKCDYTVYSDGSVMYKSSSDSGILPGLCNTELLDILP